MTINGRLYRARDADFTVVRNNDLVVETESGTRVRVHLAVGKVLEALDDNGNPAKSEQGEPLLIVQSQNFVTAEIRDEGGTPSPSV